MGDILVYGDKEDPGNVATTVPDSGNGMPLEEFPTTFNKYDGNDWIEIGDNNENVKVYGQGGDDKITGGYGAS